MQGSPTGLGQFRDVSHPALGLADQAEPSCADLAPLGASYPLSFVEVTECSCVRDSVQLSWPRRHWPSHPPAAKPWGALSISKPRHIHSAV